MTDAMIVGTSAGRPDYLQATLRSWAECKEWFTLPRMWFVEPTPLAGLDARLLADVGVAVTQNERKLGPLSNPWTALDYGFERTEFVILAEDDSTVEPDAIDYFLWAADKFRNDNRVMFVCSFQKGTNPKVEADLRAARLEDGYFAPTIWATWRDRWRNHLRDSWDHDYRHNGWDWNFTRRILPATGCGSIVPMFSRSQHIGRFGGAHCTPEIFEELQAPVPVWEQRPDVAWRLA